MTVIDFIQAIQGMTGLLPAMVDHLTGLAPSLTDNERSDAISALKPLSDQIVEKEKEAVKIVEDGLKEIEAMKRKELPKIHLMIESEEHEKAEGIFDQDK